MHMRKRQTNTGGRVLATLVVALTALVLAAPAAQAAAPTITSFTPTCGPVGTMRASCRP
jgi:hypothetical protein